MFILQVIPLTKLPLDKPQVYSYFTSHELLRGSLVLVPLYRRQVKALVIDSTPLRELRKIEIRKTASFELKQIVKVLAQRPIITEVQLNIIQWMTRYYYVPVGLIVKTILPEKLTGNIQKNLSETTLDSSVYSEVKPPRFKYIFGKNETRLPQYTQEIKNVLTHHKQILCLVPYVFQIKPIKEYILRNIPKTTVSCISSDSKITELRKNWNAIKTGATQIIIGARSAVFMPFKNLGLIIIDEEENSGHISWDMAPRYDARKVAKKIAELCGAKLVFGSATPSVEYYYQYGSHKKKLSIDKNKDGAPSEIIDMRDELRKGNYSIFSDVLLEALQHSISRNWRAILFVNRRGTFRFVMCRDCGFIIKCNRCETSMICHEIGARREILKCHHCGSTANIPERCAHCGSVRIKGFGIGTQRIEQEVRKVFPKTSVLRIDSDSVKNMRTIDSQAQIIIGTQMIFSQANLKKVNVIGIVAIDSTLNLPDFRSGERTFQMIAKLTEKGVRSIIQTYNPENTIIQLAAKGDYTAFYQQEIEQRKELYYPPFSQLIKLTYRANDNHQGKTQSESLELQIKNLEVPLHSFEILGPSPAFITKERNKWVWQILLKIKEEKIKARLLQLIPPDWEIEVDPKSTL